MWEALHLFADMGLHRGDWRQLLDEWGLHGKHAASFGSLSGGQRQRLFVALALVNDFGRVCAKSSILRAGLCEQQRAGGKTLFPYLNSLSTKASKSRSLSKHLRVISIPLSRLGR